MKKNKVKKWGLLAMLVIILVACFVAIAFLAKAESGWTLLAYLLGIITAVAAAFVIILK